MIAESIYTGLACESNWVGYCECTTVGLAKPGSNVEVVVGRVALPCHHVKKRRFPCLKAAITFDHDRLQYLNSKSLVSVDSLIGKFPLVLKSTPSITVLKSSDPHDEVVNKLNRNLVKTSS